MRALLLSVCAEGEVRAAINRAVHTTLEDILKHLGLFLNGGDHAFKKELEALLHRTARICTEIQRSKKTVEVSIEDGDLTEWAWGSLKDFGESAGPQTLGMWNLFPRIYVPEDDKVVYPGFVLWADQETPRAADQELKEFTARKRVRGGNAMNGSGSHRARRQSTVIQGSSPSTSPTSPRTDRFPLGRGTRRLQGSAVQD